MRNIFGMRVKGRRKWWPLFDGRGNMNILIVTQLTNDDDSPLRLAFWTRQFSLGENSEDVIDAIGRTIDKSLIIEGNPERSISLYIIALPANTNIQAVVDNTLRKLNTNLLNTSRVCFS